MCVSRETDARVDPVRHGLVSRHEYKQVRKQCIYADVGKGREISTNTCVHLHMYIYVCVRMHPTP